MRIKFKKTSLPNQRRRGRGISVEGDFDRSTQSIDPFGGVSTTT